MAKTLTRHKASLLNIFRRKKYEYASICHSNLTSVALGYDRCDTKVQLFGIPQERR